MQDIEFTIQENKLWMLQTRRGKRTGIAAIKIATDMVKEQLITKRLLLVGFTQFKFMKAFLKNIEPEDLENNTPISVGLPAGPGASCGICCF